MRWVSAIAGVVATASAVLVLASAAEPSPSTMPTPVASAHVTTTTAPSTSILSNAVEDEDPVVTGLDADVARALANEGYTDRLTPADLVGQLDPTVAAALAESSVVLVIPDGGDQ